MTETQADEATTKFSEAVTLATENLAADALHAFHEVVERWPDHDLADDALYNVGACYLALNQFQRAEEMFGELVERYPDATIATNMNGGRESGRTAAKAWLGTVSARLGQGDVDGARQACEELEAFADSKITPAPGIERSFHDIAVALIANSAEVDVEDADEVSPEQVVESAD